jgi:hypothetical protein
MERMTTDAEIGAENAAWRAYLQSKTAHHATDAFRAGWLAGRDWGGDAARADLAAEVERLTAERDFQAKNAADAHAERAQQFRRAADSREALAMIVGAFTGGIYCSNCGESIDDGCPANCVIGLGRKVLKD